MHAIQPAGGQRRLLRLLHSTPRGRLITSSLVLVLFASIFVGGDVLARYAFPNMGTAWRHSLLTLCAMLVTLMTTGLVWGVVRGQRVRLTNAATQLTELIKSSHANPSKPGRFVNPHLVACYELVQCSQTDCPMYNAAGQRCWEIMAPGRAAQAGVPAWVEIEHCLRCPVYRQSCPDPITELGESFNSLAFLLETESQKASGMRAQMAEKEKMVAIGQLAAGVAHEVCNPLSSISAVVQMLKRKPADPSTTGQLDIIETHVRRITDIVRKLTCLARPGDDRWEHVDVGAALDEVVRLVAFDQRARQVRIVWNRPLAPLETAAVRHQLQQVFINLALNALDAMPHGGTLSVAAARHDGRIQVRIEDSGCGIPTEIGRRVFDPFFTTKPQAQGTGLGLSVSYGIMEKHGGTIAFDSVVGEGTAFTLELPVLSAPAKA